MIIIDQAPSKITNLSQDHLEWFEERAAIIEFDGNKTKHDAEILALKLLHIHLNGV
jgi:hypothetical protein